MELKHLKQNVPHCTASVREVPTSVPHQITPSPHPLLLTSFCVSHPDSPSLPALPQRHSRSRGGVTGAVCSALFTSQAHFLANSKMPLPQRVHFKKLIFFPNERRVAYPAPRGGRTYTAAFTSAMLPCL